MRIPYLLPILFLLASCGSNANKPGADTLNKPAPVITKQTDTARVIKAAIVDNTEINEDEEWATYYVVVADTGTSYYTLHDKMFSLHDQFNIPIDTMGRYYNKEKNLIALPDNDEDEIYAGDYLPRRSPTNDLSLEYLNLYKTNAKEKMIALVAGIFESKAGADSALTLIGGQKNGFILKSEIYQGCLH